MPTNVSAFTNDSGYLTEHQSLDGYAKVSEIPTVTNDLTNELKANYDLAFAQTHTHSNKELLDNLTTETIAKYDDAVTNSHIHTNSDVLNTLSADNITNWDKAYTDSHTHTNKDELDSLTKSKLDDYDNAVVNTHSHANKTVLDNFSTADDGSLLYNNENVKGVELDDAKVSENEVWSSKKVNDKFTMFPFKWKLIGTSSPETSDTSNNTFKQTMSKGTPFCVYHSSGIFCFGNGIPDNRGQLYGMTRGVVFWRYKTFRKPILCNSNCHKVFIFRQ